MIQSLKNILKKISEDRFESIYFKRLSTNHNGERDNYHLAEIMVIVIHH